MTSATDSLDAAMGAARKLARSEADDLASYIDTVLSGEYIDTRIGRPGCRPGETDVLSALSQRERDTVAASPWGHLRSNGSRRGQSADHAAGQCESAGCTLADILADILRWSALRSNRSTDAIADIADDIVRADAHWDEMASTDDESTDDDHGAWWAAVLADAARADVATVEDVPDVPDVPAPAPTVADADTIGEWSNTPDGWRVILDDPGATLAPGRYRVRRSRKSPRWADVRPDGAGRMVRS